MARKTDIRLRRSNTANAIPTSGNLSLGEMAMNTADGALYFKTSDNTVITAHDNTIMHIDSLNDRVGIGTTSPSSILHISDDSTPTITVTDTTNNVSGSFYSSNFDSYLQSTGRLIFRTNGSNNALTISTSQDVGIGTTSPDKPLHVYHATTDYVARFESGDNQGGIVLTDATSSSAIKTQNGRLELIADSSDEVGSSAIVFRMDALNSGEIARFDVNGRLGIGTTTPGEKLEVVGNVEAEEFIGDLRGALLFKAQAGEALSKGDVVYISGISGNTTVVSKADADDSAKMPAFGVAAAAATLNSAVDIYTFGTLSGIDTSSYSEGDELYVSTTAGAMTNSAPTGSSAQIQKIAKVTRSDVSAGSIKVIGAGRTNAVPNLDQYKIFVGNSSNQAVQGNNALTVDIDNNAVGINTGDPDAYVSSLGAGLHIATDVVLNSNTPLLYLRANGGSAMSEIRYQNSLKFTNGSATLHGFIDSSGRLTFGNATNFADANADDFQIGNTSGAHGITVVSQNSHNASIYFADNDNNDAGRIIYNHTNNRMEFYTNRSQRMVITSAGNVGIGTNAAAEKLEVRDGDITTRDSTNTNYAQLNRYTGLTLKGNGTGSRGVQTPNTDALTLGTNSTERVRISSGGNVGIGTTSPDTLLHLANGGTTPATIRIERDDYSIEDTDVYGGIEFESQDNSAASAAGIRGKILGVAEGATGEMALAFETAGSYGSSTERLRINSVGQVGIGTTSPSVDAALEITKAAPNTGITTLRLTNSVNNRGQRIDFVDDNAARAFTITHDNGGNNAIIGTIVSEPLLFLTNNTERVRILSGGNVGIGESVPTEKLHVAGNIKMQASATVLTFQNNSNTWNVGCDAGDASFKFKDGTDERIRILSDGNTIFGGTSVGAAGAMSVKVDGTYTDLYLYGAGTSQGGRIFFGDSSDRSSITGTYGTGGGGKLSFKTDTTGGTSQDRLVIDSDGSIRFNNAFTFPTSIGSSGQVLKVPSTGSTLVWADDAGGGSATVLTDTDGDTKIQVEESADEDIIRFDIAGTEQMVLNSTGLTVAGNLTVDGTTTTINTATLDVEDKNITLNYSSGDSSASADGAGITIQDAVNSTTDATLLWASSPDAWQFSHRLYAPNYVVTDTNAVIYRNSNDLELKTYAGYDINLMPAGNVGINNTSPAYKLDVGGNTRVSGSLNIVGLLQSYSGTFNIKNIAQDQDLNLNVNDGGTDTTAITVQGTTANVGIGTTSPDYKLEVVGNTMIGDASAVTSPSFTARQNIVSSFQHGTTGIGRGGSLYLLNTNTNRESGFLAFGAYYNNTNNLYYQTGGIGGGKETTAGDGTWGGYLSFWTTSDGTAGAASGQFEHMRITADGNVGIGTTSPSQQLEVNGYIKVPDARGLYFSNSDANDGRVKIIGSEADDYIQFNVDNSNNHLVRLNTTGLGIGTNNPTTKLDVHGIVRVEENSNTAFYGGDYVRVFNNQYYSFRNSGGSTIAQIHMNGNSYFNGGNVGIGTTAPAEKLEVSGGHIKITNTGNTNLYINANNAGSDATIFFEEEDSVKAKIQHDASNDSMLFTDGALTDTMTLKSGRVGIGTTSPAAKLQVEEYGVDTSSTTTTATTQVAIHTFPIADFRTARFTIQITNTTDSTYHSTEIIAVHDGTTANITEFGEVHTGTSVEATFDADISSSNFRLLATPASTDSMTFKVVCHSITV